MSNLTHQGQPLRGLGYLATLVLLLGTLNTPAETNVMISEFMASNTSTLRDEDGDLNDWIEIFNAGSTAVDLNGWWLRDGSSSWQFPQTNLAPNAFLIVFASNKDKRVAGRQLHTNFQLARNGESLALLYPDGVTVASAFSPSYPIQAPDISYGRPVLQTPVTLVSTGAMAKFAVPPASSMDTLWTLPGYDDSAWASVSNGIGFEADAAVPFAPAVVADSVSEFSGNQGSNNWFYGYWDKTSDTNGIYDPTNDFVAFPRGTNNVLSDTNFWDGTKWDWRASGAPAIELSSLGGSPSGNNGNPALTNHWAIRRWVSETNGRLRITGTLACNSQGGTCGDGTIGRILVDGVEVFQRVVFGTSVGYSIIVNANVGSLIDFVIDAGAANNDLCDSTTFTATIRTAGDSAIVADSFGDWSTSGSQGVGGWYYGYWIKTNASATYTSPQFVTFPSNPGPQSAVNFWDGLQWHWFDGDPPFDTLGQVLSRPNLFPSAGTNSLEHWVIRRWVSEISGSITIDWHFSKIDLTGDGTVAKVFRNGTQIDTVTLTAADFTGATRTIAPFAVQVGDTIDFTVEPGTSTIQPNALGDICSLNATISGSTTLSNQFLSDVGGMRNVSSSAYVRIPFTVTNLLGFDTLTLRLKYDDGVVVYLNGAPVASRNAPETPVGDSTATAARVDAEASQYEEISLARARDLLVVGTNVLAMQVLNSSADDGDLLAVVELRATVVTIDGSGGVYFTAPTPGALNGAGSTTLGSVILDVSHTPNEPTDTDDLVVTALVAPTLHPVGTVRLYYRVMFGSESNVVMLDDGLHGDGAAGDGIYGATIPNTISTPGQMIRYYITSTDSLNTLMREPPFPNAIYSSQYYGTVVRNPGLTNPLPVLHLFIPDATLNSAGNDSVGRYPASVFYLGELYDNIGMNRHGQSSAGFPKKSYDLDFNPDHHFLWNPSEKRVGDVNLLTTYPDKSHMRNMLGYAGYRDSGSPYHFVAPIRVQTNGGFFGDWHMVENGGSDYLKRIGRDPNGALYKMYVTFTTPTDANLGVNVNAEKKTRKWEGNADLVALYNGVHLTGTNLVNYMYDNMNVAEVANTMAARIITSDIDCCHKNYYFYRDSDGTGEWEAMPWDIDLSFGRNWGSVPTYWDDAVYPNNGLFIGNNNSFFQALFNTPATRQMYLRRVRTIMDQYQQTNGTPANQLYYEKAMDQWGPLIAPDAALDLPKWGTWGGGATGVFATNSPYWRTLPQSVAELRTNYMPARRTFVFNSKMNNAAEFPDAQPTNVVILTGALDFNPASGNQAQEYLQLINTNRFAVDLSGWTLSGAVELKFQGGAVIPATNSMYVVADKKAFRARSVAPRGGMGLYIEGPYKGQLSARGEPIILTDTYGHARTNTYVGNPSLPQSYLRVTEIMYHPVRDPGGLAGSEEEYEYLELKNISTNATLNLNGVHFTNGIEFAFTGSAVTNLGPGQTVLLVKNLAAFTARHGNGFTIAGQYVGSLDNSGESLHIDDAVGETILDFSYNNSWYPITDGTGPSLVIVDENAAYNTWDKKSNWRPSAHEGGSPGAIDPALVITLPVLVNEILTRADPPLTDAIELFNPNNVTVDIGGWFLTDNFGVPKNYRIPDGTSIPANGFVVFYASNSFGTAFNLSSHGEEIYLFSGDANTNLTGYVHGFDFGPQANGVTFGRYLNSVGKEEFPAQITPTLGAPNAGPRVGPIVFSSINYHPPDLFTAFGLVNNEVDEFVELENTSGVTQPLFDPNFPTNTLRLRGAIEYTFPTNVSIPPGGHVMVVSFDPADAVMAAKFQATNQAANGEPLFGPFKGQLNNAGDKVELARPEAPEPPNAVDANVVYYVLRDKVEYSDAPPWASVGFGSFLHRLSGTGYGNDPTNWVVPVAITGHPLSQNVRLPDGLNPVANITLSAAASGSEPISFQWRFNGAIIPGASGSTLLVSITNFSQTGDYSVVVNNSYSSSTSRVAQVKVYSDFIWRFASLTGTLGSTPTSIGTNLLVFMQAASDAYVDDISLVPLSGTYAGINVISNGDFEGPLSGPWAVPATMGGSVITNTYARSGSYSLHVVATNGGSQVNSIKQILPPFTLNTTATLSFWYHTTANSAVVNVRAFPGSGLSMATNVQATDIAPIIAAQPSNSTLNAGSQASFSVSAYGTEPLTYQWFKDGLPLADGGKISGAATTTLVVSQAQGLEIGNYSVKVSNLIGVTNSALASLIVTGAPPQITAQPQSQHGLCQGTVTFSVGANGSGPLAYQWGFNHSPITNATNSSLVLSNLALSDQGNYSVTVSNDAGSTNSNDAFLTIDETNAPNLAVVVNGTNLVVRWSSSCVIYQLQENATLNPADWSPSSAPAQQSGNQWTVTIPIVDASKFYRLKK